MGKRKIIVKQTAADNIAAISWFIESKGMVATANKFTDDAYDFFIEIADSLVSHSDCRDYTRQFWGINVSLSKKNIPSCSLNPSMN